MKYIGWSMGAVFLLLYLVVNVFASQDFPRLFYELTTRYNIEDAQKFLQYIEGTPLYKNQYAYLNGIYENGLVKNYMAQEKQNILTKEKYRGILTQNPKSRDALVVLALYEFKAGHEEEAARFYTQAKEIDPWLEIRSLESL